MSENIHNVALKMKESLGGDERRITHFVRVYTLAKTIGELEKLPAADQTTLELSAIVNTIPADDKMTAVKELLLSSGYDDATAMRVCHIVEHRRDYDHISGLDHQILIEAEYIVRFKERSTPSSEIVRIAEKRFITNYGKAFLKKAFGV